MIGEDPGVTPYLLVALVLLAAAAAAVTYRSKRHPIAYSLPTSTVDNAWADHDRQLEREVRDELLELGEAIDRADAGPGDPATSRQAVIDHYEAAGRVLARKGGEPEVLDVVGALVLSRRGTDALEAAEQGLKWEPTTLCYLNPLHGRASGDTTVESEGRRVSVPLCSGCRGDLRAGRRPDTLDVVRRGRALHYFDSGVEPWATTGFGALEPDLIGRLHRQSR